ncbi:helix-turn-helix domain-containing protein [Brasilonema sp. UFV-L1]|uniref:RNA-guided endonuclease InsQ/TnpB family protein n=1 Tax=Brasilonema sp. UFV-L1 TaxID=2234130 RepID=UPI00145D80E1|nr:helix-turn-helix domain-containing protein [Brasilonema sp. UFV-L1]NMG07578.1 transposase [Brasilonema sp. UFV-L1]
MKVTYQYKFYPDTKQKLELNSWLRISRYWYNRQLGERFTWWQNNHLQLQAFPQWKEIFPCLFGNRPNYYTQKLQLPVIKQDLVVVVHSGELLDLTRVDSTILQDICKRVDKGFERYIIGDCDGKRSGKPRLKTEASFRTMTFATANNDWIKLVRKNWFYLRLPKIAVVKVRMHRPLPNGFKLKQVSVTKKVDGWYMQMVLEDTSVPDFNPDEEVLHEKNGQYRSFDRRKPPLKLLAYCDMRLDPTINREVLKPAHFLADKCDEITPTWENSMGLDAVLHGDDYLATSEGTKLPSLKSLRKNQHKLDKISRKRNKRSRGSKSRRKLAKKEAKQHQKIALCRKDFQYKTAHKLVRTGKKFFFHEKLNLQSLSKRNAPKQDENGLFLPNGQSAKSGLNKSWMDAAFAQFFEILGHIAGKAGAVVVPQNPAYSSQVLCYRNEIVFSDTDMREYWDEQLLLLVDRDINAAINLKRLGLDIFPRIKRRNGKVSIVGAIDKSTMNEIVYILKRTA